MIIAGSPPMPEHLERRLAVAHAHRPSREGLATLFALDERLSEIVVRGRTPEIALLRLVWWRDALAALDQAPAPAEPLLVAAAALCNAGISGEALSAMAEGWEPLLDDPDLSSAAAALHARERGARLFVLAGSLLGTADGASGRDRLADAGEGWAFVDLARHFVPLARAGPLLDFARAPLERAMAQRWPGPLRPLGMLTALALRDAHRGVDGLQSLGSRRRIVRMLAHRWTGR